MTDPITLSVSIQGTYTVAPEALQDAYGGASTPATVASIDQNQIDNGHVSVHEVLGWLDAGDINVTVTAANPEPDEDNRIFAHHVMHTLLEFNYANYGADDFPAFDEVEGGPSQLIQDLTKSLIGTVAGYFASRAYAFGQAPDDDHTSHVIARVLKHLAGEMAVMPRPAEPVDE